MNLSLNNKILALVDDEMHWMMQRVILNYGLREDDARNRVFEAIEQLIKFKGITKTEIQKYCSNRVAQLLTENNYYLSLLLLLLNNPSLISLEFQDIKEILESAKSLGFELCDKDAKPILLDITGVIAIIQVPFKTKLNKINEIIENISVQADIPMVFGAIEREEKDIEIAFIKTY